MPKAPKILKSSRPSTSIKPKTLTIKEDRGSSHSRGYGRRWRASREGYLRKHPLCVHCLLDDRVVQATLVDHIIPVSGASDPLFWERTNWQPLCSSCHGRKTATDDGGFGNKKRIRGGGG